MIGHTKAFKAYRSLSQAHLNFVVLVCHAVPALRSDLALPSNSLSIQPDHFKSSNNSKSEIAGYETVYQEELARSALITVFSYFEGYVRDALSEIVIFHGGGDELKKLGAVRTGKFIGAIHTDIKASKRKLQDVRDPAKLAKYQKYGWLLEKKGFKFPTDLLSYFGICQLLAKLDDKRGMRAWEIPSILEECLLFPITAGDRTEFETIRVLRNKIGHGQSTTLALAKSLQYASILHALAAKVDRHIAEHFLVIQVV